jgi:hypothetical protein
MAILLENISYGRTGSVPDNCISQFLIKDNVGSQTHNLLSFKLAYVYICHLRAFSGYLLPNIVAFIYLIPLPLGVVQYISYIPSLVRHPPKN